MPSLSSARATASLPARIGGGKVAPRPEGFKPRGSSLSERDAAVTGQTVHRVASPVALYPTSGVLKTGCGKRASTSPSVAEAISGEGVDGGRPPCDASTPLIPPDDAGH